MQKENRELSNSKTPYPFPLSQAASQEVFHNYPYVEEKTCGQQKWNDTPKVTRLASNETRIPELRSRPEATLIRVIVGRGQEGGFWRDSRVEVMEEGI